MAEDQLLNDGVVVRVGLIVHDPAASHDLELAVRHQGLDLLLDFKRLLAPPHGEEGNLGPDELPARIYGQFLDHVVQDLTGLRRVVLIKCLDPSWLNKYKIMLNCICLSEVEMENIFYFLHVAHYLDHKSYSLCILSCLN